MFFQGSVRHSVTMGGVRACLVPGFFGRGACMLGPMSLLGGGMPGPRSVSVEGGILEGWRYTTGRGVIPGGGYTTLGGYTYPSSCT